MFWLEAAGPPSEGPFPLLMVVAVQLLLLFQLLSPAAPTAPLPASQLLDAFGAFQL